MADTTIEINPSDVNKIVEDYTKQRAAIGDISVELSGVNELDPLVLLETMSIKNPGVRDLAPVVETMLDGRTIKFKKGGEPIWHPISYNRGSGNSLHMMFTEAPYLYDILQQTIYALLLKKSTPHLESSN